MAYFKFTELAGDNNPAGKVVYIEKTHIVAIQEMSNKTQDVTKAKTVINTTGRPYFVFETIDEVFTKIGEAKPA